MVRAGRKSATIEWDYITLPESIDGLIAAKESELIAGFQELAKKYGNEESGLRAGARSAMIDNIAIGQAEECAEALFELVTDK